MSFYTVDLCYSTFEQLVPDLFLLAVSARWITKSHLVEKRLNKKKTIQNQTNYPVGRMFTYHPSTRKCNKKKHQDRGIPVKRGGDFHRLR